MNEDKQFYEDLDDNMNKLTQVWAILHTHDKGVDMEWPQRFKKRIIDKITSERTSTLDSLEKEIKDTKGLMAHEEVTGVVDGGLELARRKLKTDILSKLKSIRDK